MWADEDMEAVVVDNGTWMCKAGLSGEAVVVDNGTWMCKAGLSGEAVVVDNGTWMCKAGLSGEAVVVDNGTWMCKAGLSGEAVVVDNGTWMCKAGLSGEAVVVDNGTWMCKAGLSGEKTARVYERTMIGTCPSQETMAEKGEYIGDVAIQKRELLSLSHPMERGEVTNWDSMEKFWDCAFRLLGVPVDERAILITEIPQGHLGHRQRLVETLIEKFRVPALYITDPASLSLYCSGRTTGVVLDVGGSVTHTATIVKGVPVSADDEGEAASLVKTHYSHIGGDDVSNYVSSELEKQISGLSAADRLIYGDSVKSSMCWDTRDAEYTLPDGTKVRSTENLRECANVLLKPSLIGSNSVGVDKLLLNALDVPDPVMRKQLLSNIVLAGGTTLTPGLVEKITSSLPEGSPDMEIKIIAPPERPKSCWMGGSVMAALSEFPKLCKTRQIYEESGWREFLAFNDCETIKQA